VIVCGGDPSPDDLAALQEFAAALALPSEHLTRLALLEMDTSGDPAVAEALERHAATCRRPECTGGPDVA
jgi:hypothetical protein